MVPVGQAVGDTSIQETVHQTGDLAPQLSAAPPLISPAELEEAEEGEEGEEAPAIQPAVAYNQVQMQAPVTDAGGPVAYNQVQMQEQVTDAGGPVAYNQGQMQAPVTDAGGPVQYTQAGAIPGDDSFSPTAQVAQRGLEVPALPPTLPAPQAPAVEAMVVSDEDAQPAAQEVDAAADGALPVVDGSAADGAIEVRSDADDADGAASAAEPIVAAATPPAHHNPPRSSPPHHTSGNDARADLSLASRRQRAGHGRAGHTDEPEEGGEEGGEEGSGDGGGGEGDAGDEGGGSPSNASQIVLDPNVKEYTVCDPPCITGRGICNDQVCFCKSIYYGSTCQHQIKEDEWLQLAPAVVCVLCLVAAVGGIALAQIIFNGYQTGRKFAQERQFGPPTVRKECWQPSKGKK